LVESIIVESCSDKIARENEKLRQEVSHLGKALYDKKGKARQTQPTQDNTTAGVNKSVEGETVVCWLCHKEGHGSYQCKAKARGDKKKTNKQDLQHLYQQGGQEGRYLILNQEKEEWKGHSHQIQQAIQQGKGSQMNLGAKRDYSTMKSTKKVWIHRGKKSDELRRI
jgi:hypothetical protein